MGTKAKNILKMTLCGVGLVALFVLSGIVGIHIERKNQRIMEMQKVHVDSIAVVNMDNGVLVGDQHVNYASQLMSFPSDRFMITGLTDAKAGIENGYYAAYVVIPETFSTSVTSIEFEPQKVTLNCQYNTNLDEESRMQAMSDVNAFIAQLNSNTAYMYLDAIMAEFHQVQDDSSTILANDNTELELLASVNAEQLIAAAEPVNEIVVADDVQPVELGTYTSQNHALLDSMQSSYSEAVQRGKEDYAVIQSNNSEVGQASDNFFSTYDSVIQDTTSEQAALLEAGREKLDNAVGAYNQDVDAQASGVRDAITSMIEQQMASDQAAVDSHLNYVVNDMKGKNSEELQTLHQRWQEAYKSLQSEVDEILDDQLQVCGKNLEELVQDIYIEGYNDALDDLAGKIGSDSGDSGSDTETDSGSDSDSDTETHTDPDVIAISDLQNIINQNKLSSVSQSDIEEFITSIEEQLSGIVIKWDQSGVVLPEIPGSGDTGEETDPDGSPDNPGGEEYQISLTVFDTEGTVENTITETIQLFKLEPRMEEISNVIQTCFVDALSEESQRQLSRLSDAKQQLNQSMESYESSLMSYDPMQYIENADLGTYLNGIESNTGQMMDTVEQNNTDYKLYAAEMYSATTEHTAELRSSLNEANTQTTDNVENCIDELISSRKTINNINVDMLKGFTNSLSYTRVESQGNTEVYDHIVNPVISRVNGQAAADTATVVPEKGASPKVWIIIILSIGIILCLTEILNGIRRQHRKSDEENGDIL